MKNNKMIAAIYFIAFIACGVTFYTTRKYGYLVASGAWLALGIYHVIRNNNDNGLGD